MTICYPFVLNPTGGSFVSTKLLVEQLDETYGCQFIFGVESSAAQTAQASGFEVDTLNPGKLVIQAMNQETSLVDELQLGINLLPYLWRVRQFLATNDIDLMHVNDGLTAMLWGTAARTARIPVIWHVRSERPNEWDRVRLHLCDHLILVAESNRRRFDGYELDPANVSVIHNGVDLSSFSPTDSKYLHDELGVSPEVQLVGFVGNLVDRKRPLLFVKSAIEVLDCNPDVHFVLVGGDNDGYAASISDLASEHGVEDNIHLLGYRSDVNDIMPSLDLLVLTSTERGEAFPRVPLEAMASGTPVVTTDTAGVSEAVIDGQTGIVLGADPSPEEISNQLVNLLQDDYRLETFADASVTHVQNRFTAERYANEVKNVYQLVIDGD